MHFKKPGTAAATLARRLEDIASTLGEETIGNPGSLGIMPDAGYRQIGQYSLYSADVDINELPLKYILNLMIFCGLAEGSGKIQKWVIGGNPPKIYFRVILKAKYFNETLPKDGERHVPFTVEIRWTE